MANKKERMLVVKALQLIKAQGVMTSWDLSNELKLPLSTFNNQYRPILRQHPLLKQTKDKKWAFRYEEIIAEAKEPEPQMSIEDWIRNNN